MKEDQQNWRLLFVVALSFVILVILFSWMNNGRGPYPPLAP
jgi:hypothetical protein